MRFFSGKRANRTSSKSCFAGVSVSLYELGDSDVGGPVAPGADMKGAVGPQLFQVLQSAWPVEGNSTWFWKSLFRGPGLRMGC